jgi:hypothetical protein
MKTFFAADVKVRAFCVAALLVATPGWAQDKIEPAPLAPTSEQPKASEPAGDAKEVPVPKGYRYWTHVKSMTIFSKKHPLYDAFGGVHHVYANRTAVRALREGKSEFPDGSVFVFDLLDISNKSGAFVEGKRKFVATIYRDAQKYADTTGWGWQAWEGGNPKKPVLKNLDDQKVCATCHRNEVSDRGFVFTQWRR